MSRLVEEFDAPVLPGSGPEREGLLDEHGAGVDIVVTSAVLGLDSTLLDRLPNVRLIASFGVGVDSIDLDSAHSRGIEVSNTPDVLTGCVADLAVGLAIDALRGVSRADRFVRTGGWAAGAPMPPLGRRLHGATVGILGLGAIGAAVADRLRGFDCRLAYHSRTRRETDLDYVADPVTLAERSDVLIITMSGGPSTRGLVSAEVLQALGTRGHLVNVSRGSVIDEEALVEAVTTGGIAGAALDVFAHEPHVPDSLLTSENVVLLPHIGSGTEETRVGMCDLVLQNITSFRSHGTLVTPVPVESR